MRRVLGLIAVIATASLSRAAASAPIAEGEARITLSVDQGSDAQPGTYEISVAPANIRPPPPSVSHHYAPGKGRIADWRLTIRCVDKCACPHTYTENLGDGSPYASGLMGVWQVLDGNSAVVTSVERHGILALTQFWC